MAKLVKLDAGYQDYAWGKPAAESFVAKMKGLTGDSSGKKYAELWVGTHPSCPSRLAEGKRELLADYLKEGDNERRFFSKEHQAHKEFHGQVPYLLKILSISTALSIQAHPDKALARRLHAEKPDKYKDPNHKPELLCALTAFEALCCFRPLSAIVGYLEAIPELAALVSAEAVLGGPLATVSLPARDSTEEKAALKGLMSHLYAADEATCTRALRAHLARVKAAAACKVDAVFARLYDQYPDDVGCWMVYILNYVEMVPGQALFLSENEPHAYISGDGVEIMACSDNVVRAGLTPKWKDVSTLISMLKYDTTGLDNARHEKSTWENDGGWQTQCYQPPSSFPDFSLYRFQHDRDGGEGSTEASLPTIGLGFCLEGEAAVNGHKVVAGDCFAVPYGEVTVKAHGKKALVFIASSNILSAAANY